MSPQSHKFFEALQEDEGDLRISSSRSNITSSGDSRSGSRDSSINDGELNDKDEKDETNDYQKFLADVAGDSFLFDDEAPVSSTISID